MSKTTPTGRGRHDGRRQGPAQGHRYELIEMAVLFGTAAIADLLVDALGHGSEGPTVLGCMSAMLIAVVIIHRAWNRHSTSPPRPGTEVTGSFRPIGRAGAADGTEDAEPEAANDSQDAEPADVGALWRIRTSVEDTPGRLAVLAGALAAAGANILTLQVHPTGTGATDEFLVRTPPGTASDKLTAAVRAAGGGEPWVGRAEVQALADPTAHALTLAQRLMSDAAGGGGRRGLGENLPVVLAELLDADAVEWFPATSGAEAGTGAGTGAGAGDSKPLASPTTPPLAEDPDLDPLDLTIPGQGTARIIRAGLPFTPAEFARARAMAELAAASTCTEPSCERP